MPPQFIGHSGHREGLDIIGPAAPAVDKRLWTEVAAASGAGGNSTADTVTCGRDVAPLVKAGVAEREARKGAAVAAE